MTTRPPPRARYSFRFLRSGLLDVARFLLVEDEDVGLVELRLGRKRRRAPVAFAPRSLSSGTHSLRNRG